MSERLEFKGDYMGFTYDNTHSSTLGIVRTSDGSRFNENLLPTIQDKTVQIPGGDGMYFFGSYYTQRQFSVSFAFDGLTEEKIGEIRRVFGDKKIHDLIFDERPYKVYSAKVTGTATLKYIPFTEGSTNRLYKGEGTIQFTCYDPFARCAFSFKENESEEQLKNRLRIEYPNIDEWWAASRISQGENFGDVPVSFKLNISSNDENKTVHVDGKDISWINLPAGVEAVLDTKIGVVKVVNSSNDKYPKGSIVNKYVTGDLTAKIPKGETVVGADFTCLYI